MATRPGKDFADPARAHLLELHLVRTQNRKADGTLTAAQVNAAWVFALVDADGVTVTRRRVAVQQQNVAISPAMALELVPASILAAAKAKIENDEDIE